MSDEQIVPTGRPNPARIHEDESGCTYAAYRIKRFLWFCSKCGWSEREAPSIEEVGAHAVLKDDFYVCPNTGEWVYKWADERLVLRHTDGANIGSGSHASSGSPAPTEDGDVAPG